MYDYIKGKLTFAGPDRVTVETQGFGFQIFMAPTHIFKLPQLETSVSLFLSYVVREDSQRFYGFLERSERQLFEQLGDVTGIGPKTALSLVGHLSVEALRQAIAKADITTLSKIPGIGKKTAERLIVEMRDKVAKLARPESQDQALSGSCDTDDAISALIHLGYSSKQAQSAVESVIKRKADATLSQLITESLKII